LSSDNLRNEAGVWGIQLKSQAIEYRHSLNHCQSILLTYDLWYPEEIHRFTG